MIFDCVCKKEQGLLGNRCDKPLEVCMAFAPVPDIFNKSNYGRVISKDEARKALKMAEEAGLVHLTSNFQNGRIYICNCCGCCCGVLSTINKIGLPASTVINSHYYAVIDPNKCTACGTCKDERCQVNAIEDGDDEYQIVQEKCIGCGLCITTCPSEAIKLVRKKQEHIAPPPMDEPSWFKERGHKRKVDFSAYE